MCKYCEGESLSRKNIGEDGHFNPVYIWGKNKLLIDNGESELIKINFCPMCGRDLSL